MSGTSPGSAPVPLVSLIIRSMHRPTLGDALGSVAAQSYPSVEVLLVNAKGGAHPAPGPWGPFPLRLLNQDGPPLARSTAANLGLDAAQGELALFLDDDDLILPPHLADLAAALTGPASTSVAAYSITQCVDPNLEPLPRQFATPYSHPRLMAGNFLPIHSVLFRLTQASRRCRFDEQLDLFEDWDFWLQLAELGPFQFLPQPTALYRISPSGGFGVNSGDPDSARRAVLRLAGQWQGRWSPPALYQLMEAGRLGFEARDQLAELEPKSQADQRLLAELQVRNQQLQQQLTVSDQALAALYDSQSWRWTRPLRRLAALVQKWQAKSPG